MEKKEACEIIDNILGLFDCINITHKHDDISGILTELKDGIDTNRELIIELVKYLRKIGLPDIRDSMKLYDDIMLINKLFTINWSSSNFNMKDYDDIHASMINIKEILNKEVCIDKKNILDKKECSIMKKKEACKIIDNILFLLNAVDFCSEYLGRDEAIELTRSELKTNTDQIIKFTIYLKTLETNHIEDNIDIYIVQTIMYDILRRIKEDGNKLTIGDFEDIRDSLINIKQNFLHKEEEKVPIIFISNPSTMSLISGADKLHSKARNTIVNDVEKMNIIGKLRKNDSSLLSNISSYDLQPFTNRILIDPNEVRNLNEVYKKILDIYEEEKLCMSNLLDKIEIRGLTVKQVVSLYAKLFTEIDNDVVVHIKKDDIINLAF